MHEYIYVCASVYLYERVCVNTNLQIEECYFNKLGN